MQKKHTTSCRKSCHCAVCSRFCAPFCNFSPSAGTVIRILNKNTNNRPYCHNVMESCFQRSVAFLKKCPVFRQNCNKITFFVLTNSINKIIAKKSAKSNSKVRFLVFFCGKIKRVEQKHRKICQKFKNDFKIIYGFLTNYCTALSKQRQYIL